MYEGYRCPHFLDCGTVSPLFKLKDEEFAVICCQHRRSAEIKLQPFSAGAQPHGPGPAMGELTTLSYTPIGRERIPPPIFLPSSQDQRAPCSPSAGPVLGMFELFGGTGPPISGGRQIRSLIFFTRSLTSQM